MKIYYIVIHSGSRHLGKEVTEYYLNKGQKDLKSKGIEIPYELTFIEGELLDDYLHDLQVVQSFASLNREIILDEIVKGMKWKVQETYECIHNYVDSGDETVKIIFLPLIALITPVILLAKAATHVSCYIIGPALLVSVILAVVLGINRDWLGIGLCAGIDAVLLIVLFGTAWLIANMEDAKENMIGFLHS